MLIRNVLAIVAFVYHPVDGLLSKVAKDGRHSDPEITTAAEGVDISDFMTTLNMELSKVTGDIEAKQRSRLAAFANTKAKHATRLETLRQRNDWLEGQNTIIQSQIEHLKEDAQNKRISAKNLQDTNEVLLNSVKSVAEQAAESVLQAQKMMTAPELQVLEEASTTPTQTSLLQWYSSKKRRKAAALQNPATSVGGSDAFQTIKSKIDAFKTQQEKVEADEQSEFTRALQDLISKHAELFEYQAELNTTRAEWQKTVAKLDTALKKLDETRNTLIHDLAALQRSTISTSSEMKTNMTAAGGMEANATVGGDMEDGGSEGNVSAAGALVQSVVAEAALSVGETSPTETNDTLSAVEVDLEKEALAAYFDEHPSTKEAALEEQALTAYFADDARNDSFAQPTEKTEVLAASSEESGATPTEEEEALSTPSAEPAAALEEGKGSTAGSGTSVNMEGEAMEDEALAAFSAESAAAPKAMKQALAAYFADSDAAPMDAKEALATYFEGIVGEKKDVKEATVAYFPKASSAPAEKDRTAVAGSSSVESSMREGESEPVVSSEDSSVISLVAQAAGHVATTFDPPAHDSHVRKSKSGARHKLKLVTPVGGAGAHRRHHRMKKHRPS